MTTPTPQPPYGHPTQGGWGPVPPVAPPVAKPSRRKAVLTHGLVAVVALGFGAGIGGSGGSDAAADSARPAPAVTVTKTAAAKPEPAKTVTKTPKPAKKAAAPATVDGDGQFLVGEDIKAGTYKTAGPQDDDLGLGCYWARLKNASGEFEAIIANGNITGQARVTVRKGEYFETKGCQDWQKVG